jgi:hypothetical protein
MRDSTRLDFRLRKGAYGRCALRACKEVRGKRKRQSPKRPSGRLGPARSGAGNWIGPSAASRHRRMIDAEENPRISGRRCVVE